MKKIKIKHIYTHTSVTCTDKKKTTNSLESNPREK